MRFRFLIASLAVVFALVAAVGSALADEKAKVIPSIDQRFAQENADETPDFQKHVMPLLGRLGCNGRACHGSFQGAGEFRLSLFGYDFKADHESLGEEFRGRVDADDPLASLIWTKPTSDDPDAHEGGKRYDANSWQGRVIKSWLEGGAEFDGETIAKLDRLEITPSEIVFQSTNQSQPLQVVAIWADGTREDVTSLCRFTTNNEQVAAINEDGVVSSGTPGDTHVVVAYDKGVVPVPVIQPVSKLVGNKYPHVETPTKVDELVIEKLRKLGIVPSAAASDAEFLRRLRLDLTGTLPSPKEVEAFLADASADKRAKKIDELLETPEYSAWWATKLCDFTGNNDTALNNVTPMRGRAGNEWYQWIRHRIADNRPYDEIAAGMILGTSRQKGESYTEYCESMSKIYQGEPEDFVDRESMPYYWARRDIRQPEEKTIAFAYSFMGMRIQCAQCHKHPFDVWSKEDFDGFKDFFSHILTSNNSAPDARDEYQKIVNALDTEGLRGGELRRKMSSLLEDGKTIPFGEVFTREIRKSNNNDRNRRGNNGSQFATLLGGEKIDLSDYDDPREPIMDWLRDRDNAFLARAFVNRVWATYFNVGIVEPADDLSLGNPPSNKALLDHLTYGFIDNKYDMKWLHREIASSRTYQTTWTPNDTNRLDDRNFSRSVPRRLPAEVAYDAIQQATMSDEKIAEFQDTLDGRSISVATASYRTQNSGSGYALMVFGRSTRDSNCDCDRSNETSLLQTVFLQNDRDVLAMIDRGRTSWVDQIRREHGGKASQSNVRGGPQRPADYEQRVRVQRQRIKKLRESGDKKLANELTSKLRKMEERFGKVDDNKPEPNEAVAKAESDGMPTKTAEAIVTQAYLRTVSRYPTDEELTASVEYVAAADDAAAGARDLLWALLNTKEFIVNH